MRSIMVILAILPLAPGVAFSARQQPVPDTATLSLYNYSIFTFRAALGVHSARDRANAAAKRLNELVDQRAAGVTVRTVPEGVLVTVGNTPAFTITAADVDTLAGQNFEAVVRSAVNRTRVALNAGAEQRSFRAIARGLIVSLVATVIFILLLRLLRIGRRRLQHRLLLASRERLHHLSVSGFKLFNVQSVLAFARRFVELIAWAAALMLAYVWLTLVLTQFAYSRPWGNALGGYLVRTLAGLLTAVLHAIPGLFTVVIIFIFTRFLTRLLGTLFDAVQNETIEMRMLHPDTVAPTRRIVVAVLWLFAIAIAYPHLPGSDSDIFKGVSVFAGLIITLGSSGVVGQAMSGLVLMYSRSLKIGEYVQLANSEGTVVDLGLLATKIRTPKGELITIPNAVVVANSTKNYSRVHELGDLVLYTSITIGYDAPWRQVHAMLREAALRTDGVRQEPAPFVLQTALSDFYVEYELNVCVDQPERRMSILAALHENIQDVFNDYGVQIMSPHFRAQPDQPVTVPKERWFAVPASDESAR